MTSSRMVGLADDACRWVQAERGLADMPSAIKATRRHDPQIVRHHGRVRYGNWKLGPSAGRAERRVRRPRDEDR